MLTALRQQIEQIMVSRTLLGASLFSGCILLSIFWLWSKRRRRNVLPPVNHVLFFPDKATTDYFSSPSKKTQQKGNLGILLKALESAQHSLDVCVFTISCQEFGAVLINAHQRGVIVRVITDNETDVFHLVLRLSHYGELEWQVRNDNTSYYMHHKFVLIDNSCLVSGSLNWTVQGVCGNQENIIVTNTPKLVQPFTHQFEYLWDKYHPKKTYKSTLVDE